MPLVAVAAVLLGTGLEILPPDALFLNLTVARLLIAAGLVALVLDGARARHFRSGLDVPIALLLLAGFATTLRGGYDGAPLRFLLTAVAFYYLTLALIRRSRAARSALTLVALVAVVASAGAGVAQVAQDQHTTYYREGFTPVISVEPRGDLLSRATGTFANPNLLAAHVLLLGPLAFLAALAAGTREVRGITWALVGLAYLGLVLTFSRAGVGAALLAAALALAARRPPARRPLAVAGGVALVALLLGTVVTGGGLIGGFGRSEAWRLGVEVAGANPLTGVGLSRGGDVMNATAGDGSTYRHAHNLWLTWWVEAGVLALVAMIWITIWLLARSARDAVLGSPWAAAGLAACGGLFAISLVDHPANVERVALAFWFVAALVAAGAPASEARGRAASGS